MLEKTMNINDFSCFLCFSSSQYGPKLAQVCPSWRQVGSSSPHVDPKLAQVGSIPGPIRIWEAPKRSGASRLAFGASFDNPGIVANHREPLQITGNRNRPTQENKSVSPLY